MESKNEMLTMDMVYAAEREADTYRESLLDMSQENNQLYDNYCKMYDILRRITSRTDAVHTGVYDADVALSEIVDIIKNVDM